MSDPTPNVDQRALIESTEGLYVVDAGPGTGKTFTVTRRYAAIVDQPNVEPEDVLLVTFTRSAATEMRERIVTHSDYGVTELADAPIQTFHSHCHDILQEYGYAAPTHLGIDDRITGSTRIIEDDLVETALFREFIDQFRSEHSEHADLFRALSDPTELLELINQLAAKGVFPTAEGWYRDGEAHLDGDFEAFEEQFDAVNVPRNDGRKQSELRSALSRFGGSKTYRPDAPSKSDLRGGRGTKQLPEQVAREVFEEDRTDLKAFVHDVYYEYLRFALRRNYLTFGFLQLFAFVALCEDPTLRERASFEYVMVDEFQDSSEIQFKLALLLADTDNLCVVGDWKQSIYAFQYAAVENILNFEQRLERFAADLNRDQQRVTFDVGEVEHIELRQNYRSTQTLVDFSEQALVTPATKNEDVDESITEEITELESNAAFDNTYIEGCHHEDEHEAVLAKIQAIVDSDEYAVEDEGGDRRPPTHSDIAVLTRTRDFGRELLEVANDHELPMAYDGGVELFRTDPAKLLLAWLRILEADADRGWAVVLERAGYTRDEIEHVLETGEYPAAMADFRAELAELEAVGAVARRVFDQYGLAGDYAEVLLHFVQSLHDATTLTRGELVDHIERGIEAGATHDVHTSADDDSVTVQTIHAAKGLEYPIVILANMNSGKFPPHAGGSSVVHYEEPVGLRQRKVYAEDEQYPHVYDNWRYDVYRRCLPDDHDEERRLLYVAITRAESHVVFVGGEEPNTFLDELPVDLQMTDTAVDVESVTPTTQSQLPFAVSPPEGPTGYSPHSLMDDSVFEGVDGGKGMEYGTRVHEFAEQYAEGVSVEPSNDDEGHVRAFIDSLSGELRAEENAYLPVTIDGDRVTIFGVVDLLHVTDEEVEIVDYKTDRGRDGEPEYRKQLSVYYHVVRQTYPERRVTPMIFYTAEGTRENVDPIPMEELIELVSAVSAEEKFGKQEDQMIR